MHLAQASLGPFIAALIVIVVLIFLGIFFYFLKVWIRALAAGAHVSLFNLIGMKLRGIKPWQSTTWKPIIWPEEAWGR